MVCINVVYCAHWWRHPPGGYSRHYNDGRPRLLVARTAPRGDRLSTTAIKPRPTTEDDITAEVLRRFDGTQDPRLKVIMQSLVKHVHAFLKEVQLTEAEWWKGIEFLTKTGQMCDDRRQEFILLSDTLGISMVTDLMSNRKPAGATESTVLGPSTARARRKKNTARASSARIVRACRPTWRDACWI